jgi:hypothetical protein
MKNQIIIEEALPGDYIAFPSEERVATSDSPPIEGCVICGSCFTCDSCIACGMCLGCKDACAGC